MQGLINERDKHTSVELTRATLNGITNIDFHFHSAPILGQTGVITRNIRVVVKYQYFQAIKGAYSGRDESIQLIIIDIYLMKIVHIQVRVKRVCADATQIQWYGTG